VIHRRFRRIGSAILRSLANGDLQFPKPRSDLPSERSAFSIRRPRKVSASLLVLPIRKLHRCMTGLPD